MTQLSPGPAGRGTPTVLRALAILAIGFALTLVTVQLVVSGRVTYPPSRVISDGTAILVQALLVMLLARKFWR